jgi:riboflavin kinase/FMN adenylyltransferase
VEEIPRQDVDQVAVSSTKIRKALDSGDIETANHFLGRPYTITGRVVTGDKLGRLIGYPTANIEVDSTHKLIPSDGIYAVTVIVGPQKFGGMLYIGSRPTVGGGRHSIEVNIFDFSREIYGESLTLHLHKLIRHDAQFTDLEALKHELNTDKQKTIEALKELLPHG